MPECSYTGKEIIRMGARRCMVQAAIPVLRNGRREEQHFKASPTYIENLGLAWDRKRFCQKKNSHQVGKS